MTITYIETAGVTNDWLRAMAGAHRLCVGYPDGVPETWRTPEGGVSYMGQVPENAGKRFMDETRAFPEGELGPAALLGPATEPVDWSERDASGDEEC